MKITSNDWDNYINGQNAIKSKARELMQEWINKNGIEDRNALIGFANSLSTKYGEAAAAYACEMYEEIAAAAGVAIESAVPAATATFEETAKAVNGSLKQSPEGRLIPGVVERLVKQAGADTILHNAARDQAWFAWVPSSGSCAFCRVLASNGWRKASKSLLNSHAEHIHANCNCEFVVSFSPFMEIEGYDPEKYLEEYENASAESAGFNKKRAKGKQWQSNSTAKINAMRREDYLIDKEFINEQKRNLYAENKNDDIIIPTKTVSGHEATPKTYRPNTVIDHIGNDDKTDVRSFYGDTGTKDKDIHTTDHGNPKRHKYGQHGEHAHDYNWDIDGRLKDKTTRELTEKEKHENRDIL